MKKVLTLLLIVVGLQSFSNTIDNNSEETVNGKGGKTVGCIVVGGIFGLVGKSFGAASFGCAVGGNIGDFITDHYFDGWSVEEKTEFKNYVLSKKLSIKNREDLEKILINYKDKKKSKDKYKDVLIDDLKNINFN